MAKKKKKSFLVKIGEFLVESPWGFSYIDWFVGPPSIGLSWFIFLFGVPVLAIFLSPWFLLLWLIPLVVVLIPWWKIL